MMFITRMEYNFTFLFKVVNMSKVTIKGNISNPDSKNDACSGEIDHAVVSVILEQVAEGVDILSSSIASAASFIVMGGCPDSVGDFCGYPFSSGMGN